MELAADLGPLLGRGTVLEAVEGLLLPASAGRKSRWATVVTQRVPVDSVMRNGRERA